METKRPKEQKLMAAAIRANSGTVWRAESTALIEGYSSETKSTNCYAWILWFLWKNRNKLLFEGSEFRAVEIVDKAYVEPAVWFEAQKLDREGENCNMEPELSHRRTWSKPARN